MEHDDAPRMAAFEVAPWTNLLEMALGRARKVPTMLSIDEQKLYFWLTAFWAEGAGEVVDLGCFVGGSTARLAEGAENAGLAVGLHGYDRFTAHAGAKEGLLYPNGVAPFDGGDILPLALEMLKPWERRVTLHSGEIDQMAWEGGPIEILVIDAAKRAETMDRISARFLPHLLPGRSVLVHQDFLHWSQPWVPAQMELLSDCFEPLAHVERDTVVFLCKEVPDETTLATAMTAALDDAALFDLLKTAQARYAALGWGLTDRLERMVLGLLANPGKRAAHQFEKP